MGSVVLTGASSGSTTITPTDGVTATVTLPSTGGTLQTSGAGFTTNGVAYASSTSALATGSALTFDGTNLGVGTSSPNRKLEVNGYARFTDGTVQTEIINGGGVGYIGTNNNYPVAFQINQIEQMRLTSTGLGIGTSSPSAKLQVKTQTDGNAWFRNYQSVFGVGSTGVVIDCLNDAANAIVPFGIRGSFVSIGTSVGTAATFDASGNLLVGTTSTSSTSGTGLKITAGSSQADSLSIVTGATTNAGLTTYQLYSTGASAYRFYVGAGGTIYATSTSITAISDQSLKTNIKDLETGLAQVLALQPRRFDWINGDATNVAGFVAQEVEQVLPDLVFDFKYNDTETKRGLKMGDMLPTLVKAIQELSTLITAQSATIQSLTARLTALENK